MAKKTPRGKLIKQLDDLSKQIVRLRDGNTCQKCRKWVEGSNRQVSHVIPVSAGNKLRWEPLNMKVLCYHDHLNFWHKNPMEASAWFAETFPDRWKFLQANRGMYKFTLTELEEMVNKYKEEIDAQSHPYNRF